MATCFFTGNPCAFTQEATDKFSDFVGFIMSYRGLCEFLDSPFSLLVSFSVLAGTGNSTTTLRYCILEQNNCFFLGPNDVAVSFLAFCGIQTIIKRSGLTFPRN